MSETKFEVDRDKLEVRITRTFNASPERLWRAYSDPEEIIKWWDDTKVDKLELKVGGAWRFVSVDKDGKEHAFSGEYTELDEPHKMARTFEYEPFPGHVMVESVSFEAQPDNKTKVITVSKYENLNDLNGMVGMGMETGATAGLERLAKLVENQ
jgi:uncharacterized protein YndB with AHSA1/START domain